MTTQTCTKCEQNLPLDAFAARPERNKVRGKGRTSWCKPCLAKLQREYYAKRRREGTYYRKPSTSEQYRQQNLKKCYGITVEKYDMILTEQGNVCAACGGPPIGKLQRLYTDHDHNTGVVRGLLCYRCNTALGMVQDNPEHLRKLVEYLATHRRIELTA